MTMDMVMARQVWSHWDKTSSMLAGMLLTTLSSAMPLKLNFCSYCGIHNPQSVVKVSRVLG